MHREFSSQVGASLLLVLVGVALTCSIAFAIWFWITPQRGGDGAATPTASAPVSIPTVRTMPPAQGRQAMAGSNASADIEQRVQSLADASRRSSPDVSQFPAGDSNNDPWPETRVETRTSVVESKPQTSSSDADTARERVKIVLQQGDNPQARQSGQQDVAPEAPSPSAVPGNNRVKVILQKGDGPEAQPPAQEQTAPAAIDAMLVAARRYLARDRLTTPAGENALESFRAVLARDPTNEQATSGLHDIVDRYVALARRVANKGRFDKAESFLQRAEGIGVKADVLLAVRDQMAEMRANQ